MHLDNFHIQFYVQTICPLVFLAELFILLVSFKHLQNLWVLYSLQLSIMNYSTATEILATQKSTFAYTFGPRPNTACTHHPTQLTCDEWVSSGQTSGSLDSGTSHQ
jgi:hypothetical protein